MHLFTHFHDLGAFRSISFRSRISEVGVRFFGDIEW